MMDLQTSSQPPPGGILHFFPTVDKMGPEKRECCADAFLRMVSDSPPGHPKSCLAAGAQCPFKLALPAQNARTIMESPEVFGYKGITIPAGIFSTALMGMISIKLAMFAFLLVGTIMIRSMRRRRNPGGGGGGLPAPTAGDQCSSKDGEEVPTQDEQANEQAMAWEVSMANFVVGND